MGKSAADVQRDLGIDPGKRLLVDDWGLDGMGVKCFISWNLPRIMGGPKT